MMARWLTVLVALVAQGMALMSPVCFVRCVAPNGHECVELTGQDCRCCDCLLPEPLPQLCAVATCGHDHEDEEQAEPDARNGWQLRCEHCSCHHSPLESIPQVQSKSLVPNLLTHALDFVPIPATLDFQAATRALENAILSGSGGLRPHLTVLATVVLRV